MEHLNSNFNLDGKLPFREDPLPLPEVGFYLSFNLETADDFTFSKDHFFGDNPEYALLVYNFFTKEFSRFETSSSYSDTQQDLIVNYAGSNNSGITNDIMSIKFFEIKKSPDGKKFIIKTYFLNA